MIQGFCDTCPTVRAVPAVRGDMRGFKNLNPRNKSDPMRLYTHALAELDHYFSIRGLTYLSGQRELLAQAVEAVLQAVPGTATAIPFQPGLGKSTLIRALLEVFSNEFRENTSIAQAIGGVIVVVEKTAEADELEELCNGPENRPPVARAISAPNDYNLAQGKCLNGTAATYRECPGRNCPDYADCPLTQSASQTHDTPILIMLHARYQRHMEDMTPFLTWENEDGEHTRTLLLVDELPSMIEDNALDLDVLNKIESELAQFKPSYQRQLWKEKSNLLYEWNVSMRSPYFQLSRTVRNCYGMYGLVSHKELEEAGFIPKKLETLTALLAEYLGTENHASTRLVKDLKYAENAYYAVGQDFSLFFPKLRKVCGENQPATFLFSGTASLSPELSRNPDIKCFPDKNLESFGRLRINIQRGDLFNSSKSGLAKKQNRAALVSWFHYILPQIAQNHKKILLVTYKGYAEALWNSLQDFHDLLIPYIGSDGQAQSLLPYFGGLNGSNLYRESTCVICAGLNRFEPRDYISRTLALDFNGACRDEINTVLEVSEGKCRLDSFPCVMEMQDITLARDIVQLVFRSALRNHGETRPIELWILQPPNGVIQHLKNYFIDCQIREHTELPESCRTAAVISREYMGEQSHAGKLLSFLMVWDGRTSLTPKQIRTATGLSPEQFKEAKKHPEVQHYFKTHIRTSGSGKNTIYCKIRPGSEPDREMASA